MRRRVLIFALWSGVVLLAVIGVTASVARGSGVLDSRAFWNSPVPELSRLDRENMRVIGVLLRFEPGTAAYRDIEAQNIRFLGRFNQHPTATLLHVLPAALFMVLAPLQFSRGIRSRHRRWHRWSGRVIVTIALPVGLSGLYFGLLMPFAGVVEASAIVLFGGLFFFSLIRAFIAIRQRDVARHREWMMRMFAVAIGVSSVRIAGTILFVLTRQGPEVWFGASVWIGFLATLALCEVWLRHERRRPADA
jgi:uncharacterized membrane protein